MTVATSPDRGAAARVVHVRRRDRPRPELLRVSPNPRAVGVLGARHPRHGQWRSPELGAGSLTTRLQTSWRFLIAERPARLLHGDGLPTSSCRRLALARPLASSRRSSTLVPCLARHDLLRTMTGADHTPMGSRATRPPPSHGLVSGHRARQP